MLYLFRHFLNRLFLSVRLEHFFKNLSLLIFKLTNFVYRLLIISSARKEMITTNWYMAGGQRYEHIDLLYLLAGEQ